jgi:hypothetical protein
MSGIRERAGTIAALYRTRFQGWSKEKAWAEQKSYGFGPPEGYPKLYAYIYGGQSETTYADAALLPNRFAEVSDKEKSTKKMKKKDDDDDSSKYKKKSPRSLWRRPKRPSRRFSTAQAFRLPPTNYRLLMRLSERRPKEQMEMYSRSTWNGILLAQ